MRRTRGRHLLTVLGALALVSVALPAFAATTCTDYPGLTARIIGCIRTNIDTSATAFFTQIYPYVQNTISAVMTLAVILYGIMLSLGAVEKVGRDTYIVMMKLACVVVFCNSSPWIVSTITGAMDDAALAVVSYVPTSGAADGPPSATDPTKTDFNDIKCLSVLRDGVGDTTMNAIGVWLGVDCIIDTVIGIHIEPDTPPTHGALDKWFNPSLEADGNQGMTRSLIYLFFGAMQSSVLGLMMAAIGFFFIYGLIVLIVRCLFIYIAGYMGVTFLTIISPLIIPLILFNQTKQYFDKWAKMLVSFALQPVIMLVFLVFSIVGVDLSVYDGSYSIYYAIAGDASRTATFDLNKYLTTVDPADHQAIIGASSKTVLDVKADNPSPTPREGADTGGITNGLKQAKCTKAEIAADPTLNAKCNFYYPVAIAVHTINWAKMETLHTPAITAQDGPDGLPEVGLAIKRNVLSAVFFCLMVVFIMNGILGVVPAIVGDLLGDLNQAPVLGKTFGGGTGASKLMGTLKGAVSSKVGNPMSLLGGGK